MTLASGAKRLADELRRGLGRPLDARLVFLHVPKCGGNSLRLALRDAYRRPFSGGSRRRFQVSPAGSRAAAEALGVPLGAFRDALLRYHLHDPRRRLFTGHFDWPEGIQQEFPDVSLVTLLRDPVAHFLSCYYEARQAGRSEESLAVFLEGGEAQRIGTRFVQAFAGRATSARLAGPGALASARRNLASVSVLGVLEDLPGFVADFRQRFGARLCIPHANAGRLRRQAEREGLSDALRARIASCVSPNQALYDFALGEISRRRAAAGGHP